MYIQFLCCKTERLWWVDLWAQIPTSQFVLMPQNCHWIWVLEAIFSLKCLGTTAAEPSVVISKIPDHWQKLTSTKAWNLGHTGNPILAQPRMAAGEGGSEKKPLCIGSWHGFPNESGEVWCELLADPEVGLGDGGCDKEIPGVLPGEDDSREDIVAGDKKSLLPSPVFWSSWEEVVTVSPDCCPGGERFEGCAEGLVSNCKICQLS